MTRRLLLTYLVITAFVLLVLVVPLGLVVARNERDRLSTRLELDATVLATFVEETLEHGGTDGLDTIADGYSRRTGARVVVVDATGTAVADAGPTGDEDSDVGSDFATRPEVQIALGGSRAGGRRYSNTLGQSLQYAAVPVASGGTVYGAVRLTHPAGEVDSRVNGNWVRLGLLSAVVLATTAAVGALLARSFTRPLRQLESVAERLADGDLGTRAGIASGPHEIRHLAAALDGMAARIEDLLVQQSEFTANVSHDLRTPLTALQLRLENLQDSIGGGGRDEVEAALSETARLSRLVDRLLAFARTQHEPSHRVTGDIAAVARERTATWTFLADERGVVLRCEAPDALRATTVPDAPEQILDNLIANALEAAPEGSEVVVLVERDDEWVDMHVLDAGPGMTAAERSVAFERLWRGRGSSDGGGTGLGLAIVNQLARSGGGEAGLDEAPGGGLDAWVRFAPA